MAGSRSVEVTAPTRPHVAEPAAHFDRRPRLVVDTSLLAAFLFAEEAAAEAAALLEGRAPCAPALVGLEPANVAMNTVRRGAIESGQAAEVLARAERLGIERFEVDPGEALLLAFQYGLSAHDAAYLHLAARLEAPLATFDARLGQAARRHLPGDGPPRR
jgi:predicted nucleic acid-binding protein